MTELSKNAQNLLGRLKSGRFYRAYDPQLPKAMEELEKAGLVKTMARAEVISLCWVPVNSVPFTEEKIQ